jgi:hypothetical protein
MEPRTALELEVVGALERCRTLPSPIDPSAIDSMRILFPHEMPRPYPREFREDVIRVARRREPGVRLRDIASDFGISESCLNNWLARGRLP